MILSLLAFFLPIQAICVLSLLTFNPEKVPNISKVLSAACNDSMVPSSISVVSSANCINLNSALPILTPFTNLLFLMRIVRICPTIINK